MTERWVVQSYYGGQRLTDEMSDATYSVVLPENGSYPEDTVCEVWGTERDDIEVANEIVRLHNESVDLIFGETKPNLTLLKKLLESAWGVDVKYNKDNTIRRMVIDVRDTTVLNSAFVDRSMSLIESFVADRETKNATKEGA